MTEPEPPTQSQPASHDLNDAIAALHSQLGHLERLVGPEARAVRTVEEQGIREPSWLRAARGEERWPVTAAVAVAILLEVALPDRLTIGPRWLLPVLEAALAVGLVVANPRRIDRTSTFLRAASVGLIATISVANGWSTYELIRDLINGTMGDRPGTLLSTGAGIYLTNIIVFALWYWEWDRGGPVARAQALRRYPDFMFPQMGAEHLAPEGWRPTFLDYLYTSYTNATAFSPTDTMPLAHWAKVLMAAQSAVAVVTVALVIARAVNVLK